MSDITTESIAREIAAKKRRLEELKAKRLQRQTTPNLTFTHSTSPSTSSYQTTSHNHNESNEDILDVVNSLITASPISSPPPSNESTITTFSSPPIVPLIIPPQLVISPQPSVTIPSVDVIHYDVSCQTTESYLVASAELGPAFENESKQNDKSKRSRQSTGNQHNEADSLNELADLRAERDSLRLHEIELLTTVKQLKDALSAYESHPDASHPDHVIVQPQLDALTQDPGFVDFFARSSTLMERVLQASPAYDVTVDYRAADEDDDEQAHAHSKLRYKFTWSDPLRTANRPVSAIDWSAKYPELALASYASNALDETGNDDLSISQSMHSAQGCVLLWNVHLSARPEYEFTADSSILTAFFHPAHPKLIIGGSASGQLLLWDTRAKRTPVNRTSLANSHTQPIYVCRMMPNINGSHSVLSVSSDGHVCVWAEENWHDPIASYQIARPQNQSHASDLTVNCVDFAGRDYHTLVFGSDDGSIHKTRLAHTQTSDPQQRAIFESIKGAHAAPISSLSFQPSSAVRSAASSPLYLTSSYDWTVKLWSAHSNLPIAEFERARDYVFDAAWHPHHPSTFVSGDATGTLQLWKMGARHANAQNLSTADDDQIGAQLVPTGFDTPDLSVNVRQAQSGSPLDGESLSASNVSGPAISKVRWNTSGSQLAVGSSVGEVSLFDLESSFLDQTKEEEENWWQFVQNRSSGKK